MNIGDEVIVVSSRDKGLQHLVGKEGKVVSKINERAYKIDINNGEYFPILWIDEIQLKT